jgi:hypothetical protein
MALQNWGPLLLTAAARDGLLGWDLRADTKAFSLPGTPHQVRPSKCSAYFTLPVIWLLVGVELLVADCNNVQLPVWLGL